MTKGNHGRARRASTKPCHGKVNDKSNHGRVRPTRIVIILYIYSAGEACLAPTKPCHSKVITK